MTFGGSLGVIEKVGRTSLIHTVNTPTLVSNMWSPHIIIVGGGLGGLCLAQGLKKAGIRFSLFERDPCKEWRPQGFRLRINPDGAAALHQNLPEHLWQLFETTCATTELGMTTLDAIDARVTSQRGGAPPETLARRADQKTMLGPFTADRTVLRELLMLGLEEHIHFAKEFTHYTLSSPIDHHQHHQHDDGSTSSSTSSSGKEVVTAHFADGSQVEGHLLVGADGLRSVVRRQFLPHHVPVDTDGRCIYGKTPLTPELLRQFPAEAMRWMTLISDATPLTLFLEPIRFHEDPAVVSSGRVTSVRDYVYWVLLSRRSTFGMDDAELFRLSKPELVQLSLKLTQSWHPAVRSLLELQCVGQVAPIRIASALPVIPKWRASSRVTLVGDAVHVMSPTGGVGANTALQDAARLCDAIRCGGVTEAAIGAYEEQMREYAGKAIEGSYHGGKRMYNQAPFEQCSPVEL
jgi:2-polyprenyl-6-methoxyphenol hydroxylase-like FAD-dependent oxidoreductase